MKSKHETRMISWSSACNRVVEATADKALMQCVQFDNDFLTKNGFKIPKRGKHLRGAGTRQHEAPNVTKARDTQSHDDATHDLLPSVSSHVVQAADSLFCF